MGCMSSTPAPPKSSSPPTASSASASSSSSSAPSSSSSSSTPSSSPSTSIVIIGAGFAGLEVARRLDDFLAESESFASSVHVTLIECKSDFVIGGTHQVFLQNAMTASECHIPYTKLRLAHVEFLHATVTQMDLDQKQIVCQVISPAASTRVISYNRLVLAVGSVSRPQRLPGLQPLYTAQKAIPASDAASSSIFDMCSFEDSERLKEWLQHREKGNIVLSVPYEGPYKCPPAPFEWVLIFDHMLTKLNKRQNFNIVITTAMPTPVPTSSPKEYLEEMASCGIEFVGGVTVKEVRSNELLLSNDRTLPYDAFVAMFPQGGADLLASTPVLNVNKPGYLPTDTWTLAVPDREGVYAVGDGTWLPVPAMDNKPHPKAGGMARKQGGVVAQNLIAWIKRGAPITEEDIADKEEKERLLHPVRHIDGENATFCPVELARGRGSTVNINFLKTGNAKPSQTWGETNENGVQAKIEWVKQTLLEFGFQL